jgi:hypothetical protein
MNTIMIPTYLTEDYVGKDETGRYIDRRTERVRAA